MITPSEVRNDLAREKIAQKEPLPFATSINLSDIPALMKMLDKNKPMINQISIHPERGGSVIEIRLDGFLKEKKEFRIDDTTLNTGGKNE